MLSKDGGSRSAIGDDFLYRLGHPLGVHVLDVGANSATPIRHIVFDVSHHSARVAVVERLKGRSGWLALQRLIIDSFDREEHLLFSAFDDTDASVDQETCEKMFLCAGNDEGAPTLPEALKRRLVGEARRHEEATIARSLEQNSAHFHEAREQLEKWAEDMEIAAQRELDDVKKRIRALNRESRLAPDLQAQHDLQEEILRLEKRKRALRQRIFDVEDEIAEKRDTLISALERRLQQRTAVETLFSIRWTVR